MASRNIVHRQKKTFYVVSVSAFILLILFVKPIRSLFFFFAKNTFVVFIPMSFIRLLSLKHIH